MSVNLVPCPLHTSVQRFAQKSCYDQVVWTDREGVRHAARVTEASIKAALLACGTRGRFTVYAARSGNGHSISWRVGIAYFRNLRAGYYSHGD